MKALIRAILGDRRSRQLKSLIRWILGRPGAPLEEARPASDPRSSCQAMMHRPYDSIVAMPSMSQGGSRLSESGVRRVVAAYCASITSSSVQPTSIWENIANTQQAPLHQILTSGDLDAVTALLSRPGDSDLFYGIDNLYSGAVNTFKTSPEIAMGHAKLCQDHLIRLAELTGAIRFENPEWQSRDTAPDNSADSLVVKIENAIGYPLHFPNPYPDESGIQTERGIISYRAIHAIYQGWRIRELVEALPNPRVLEIGGGLGRTAYYARQFGVSDYTIIDLPFTGVSQATFLMQAIGEGEVSLQGEPGDGAGKIKLLRPDSFLNESGRYDLVVNVDSLTEMDRATAERYLEKIEASAPMFLSINHEANEFTVKELFARNVRPRTGSRCEYGLRHGYVEELYSFS